MSTFSYIDICNTLFYIVFLNRRWVNEKIKLEIENCPNRIRREQIRASINTPRRRCDGSSMGDIWNPPHQRSESKSILRPVFYVCPHWAYSHKKTASYFACLCSALLLELPSVLLVKCSPKTGEEKQLSAPSCQRPWHSLEYTTLN